jgi:centrin-3
MKALGIYLTKEEVTKMLERVDKDGSGQLDHTEFLGLMSEILYKRDSLQEMKKVFRYYDNDDDGSITAKNIYEAADLLDLEDEVNESNVDMMLEMADKKKKGRVEINDFLGVMTELGLIWEKVFDVQSEHPTHDSDYERAR